MSSSSSSSSSFLLGKRERDSGITEELEVEDELESGELDLIERLGQLDYTRQKFSNDFDELFKKFKDDEFKNFEKIEEKRCKDEFKKSKGYIESSEKMFYDDFNEWKKTNYEEFKNENCFFLYDEQKLIKEYSYGYLPFSIENADRLDKIIHDNEYFQNSFDEFIQSSLARYLSPNILLDFIQFVLHEWEKTRWMDVTEIDFDRINKYTRFTSQLFISLCNQTGSGALKYYITEKRGTVSPIFEYLHQLRLKNLFEFTYIFLRLDLKNIFEFTYNFLSLDECIELEKLYDFLQYNFSSIGIGTYSHLPLNDMDWNEFFEPLMRSFIVDKNWSECIKFFDTKFEFFNLQNSYFPNLSLYIIGFMDVLNDPFIVERIRNSHTAGLERGYFKVFEQIYEFCPYFIMFLLKTNLYEIYNPKIINHLLQKYINLITLVIQDNCYSKYEHPDPAVMIENESIMEIISTIENYKQRTGFNFHITYIPCSSLELADDNKQIELLFLWFRSITIKEADLAKYREKCPKIFSTERWNTLEREDQARVPVPVPVPVPVSTGILPFPIGPRIRRPSVEFPRTNTLDRVFYYCFF